MQTVWMDLFVGSSLGGECVLGMEGFNMSHDDQLSCLQTDQKEAGTEKVPAYRDLFDQRNEELAY